jgi:hypothetical protein
MLDVSKVPGTVKIEFPRELLIVDGEFFIAGLLVGFEGSMPF